MPSPAVTSALARSFLAGELVVEDVHARAVRTLAIGLPLVALGDTLSAYCTLRGLSGALSWSELIKRTTQESGSTSRVWSSSSAPR